MEGDDDETLVQAARDVQESAYVPYSEYAVGAALGTTEGEVFVGCNLENANYSNTLHAEEVAIAEAFKNGQRSFAAIAVSSSERDAVTPCGMCRQTLAEFCDADFRVLCDAGEDGVREHTLGTLLPETIGPETLGK
jgi:cytidine deaminase